MSPRRYKVVECPRCRGFQITTASKTYRCFRCGSIIPLEEAEILFASEDPGRAREFLTEKMLRKPEKAWFKPASKRR